MRCRDFTGMVYGRLTVVKRFANDSQRRSCWECICECGKVVVVKGGNLTSGNTRSCGCLLFESRVASGINNRKRSIKDSTIYSVYSLFGRSAKKRGHEFSLTENEFMNIASMPCSYCGATPKEAIYQHERLHRNVKKIMSGVFIHGIDRIDNKLGYINGNLAPCCGDCNRSKGKLTVTEFKSLVARQHAFMFNKSKEVYMGLDTQDVSYMEAA